MAQTIIISFLLMFFVCETSLCNNKTDEILRAKIYSEVKKKYDSTYWVPSVVNIDSALNNTNVLNGNITDPFSTLKHCTIFVACSDGDSGKNVIGIYKKEKIIWQTVFFTNDGMSMFHNCQIIRTLDLNNDSTVELVVSTSEGMRGDLERLWIYSWNGSTGKLISAVDEEKYSVILSFSDCFDFVDVNGDTVKEIRGKMLKNEKEITPIYSWNGKKFGAWKPAPKPLKSGYYPQNLLKAVVSAKVTSLTDSLVFIYNVRNDKTSIQKINKFALDANPEIVEDGFSQTYWDLIGLDSVLTGWMGLPGFDRFIEAGDTSRSFMLKSVYSPTIVHYYLLGDNEAPLELKNDVPVFNRKKYLDNVRTNSVSGFTLAPSKFSNNTQPVEIIDSLISYTKRSEEYGWIVKGKGLNKYENYLGSMRSSIQKSDNAGTLSFIHIFLKELEIDRQTVFSSEAYSLLRYNAEFLLTKLR